MAQWPKVLPGPIAHGHRLPAGRHILCCKSLHQCTPPAGSSPPPADPALRLGGPSQRRQAGLCRVDTRVPNPSADQTGGDSG